MKIPFCVCVAGLFLAGVASANAQPAPPPPPNPAMCAPQNGLQFVCGVRSAEDETLVPGTRWIITTGKLPGEGLKLVDTDAKTERLLFTGEARPDKKLYPNCPSPADPKTYIAHGLYLRAAKAAGHFNLYVVNHGGREAIEVFDLDMRGAMPSAVWTGCVLYPQGVTKGNGVAAYSDGTIITTDEERPGTNIQQELNGEPTGDVLEWKPGDAGFRIVAGTQVAGNNGIEISRDESEFYVVAYGARSVTVFARKDPSKPLRASVAPGFTPDNIRWSGDRLLGAGPTYDEPACGGTPLEARARPATGGRCNRGYVVAELDTKSMVWHVVAYAEPASEITGVSTGVILGNTLWISANFAEGLAYRPLPGH